MNNNIIFLFRILTIGMFLSSCDSIGSKPSPSQNEVTPDQLIGHDCLPPIVKYEYPAGLMDGNSGRSVREHVLPPGTWQPQSKLPDEIRFSTYSSIAYRSKHELWFSKLSLNYENIVLKYDITSSEWEKFNTVDNKFPVVPEKLFIKQDSRLWGIGYERINGSPILEESVPLLSLYNDKTNRFEFVRDVDHILVTTLDNPNSVKGLREDRDGTLWFIFKKDNEANLYRFNSDSKKAQKVLSLSAEADYQDIEIMLDGSIWLLDTKNEAGLLRYYPDRNELAPYPGTFSYSVGEDLPYETLSSKSYLYLDRSNQLWVDDRGWLAYPSSERPSWHRVIRSPLFINLYLDGVGNYYWDRPSSMYQSTNGLFWFSADVGIISLDPESGEWCLFTTYPSPVVEDDNQNLWIVANNQLYKYHLKKR